MDYVSPVVVDVEDMSEGVYLTGSGSGDCWTIDYTVPQEWNGQAKVIEIHCKHSASVYHGSKGTIINLTFNQPLTNAYAENSTNFAVSFAGTAVKIERTLYADAFYSGDDVTFKLFVSAGSEDKTKLLSIVGKSIECIYAD